jgi:hypothetical protein
MKKEIVYITMEKKQTSIEWLESQINLGLSERGLISAIKEAKQMEKQQIEDAFKIGSNKGYIWGLGYVIHKGRDEYNYYNETFGESKTK